MDDFLSVYMKLISEDVPSTDPKREVERLYGKYAVAREGLRWLYMQLQAFTFGNHMWQLHEVDDGNKFFEKIFGSYIVFCDFIDNDATISGAVSVSGFSMDVSIARCEDEENIIVTKRWYWVPDWFNPNDPEECVKKLEELVRNALIDI